ncbi:T9SS type B sorting domain-containing protein [Deminuibacter soli]|uniref:PKD domain-containing protein n=1 Tax=Deminuibacter soli TaxID=2291815 RepID=A0A3E1NI46_9BACT|nr:gliding motility-associated C-terminal domain-containing protein [Deminuibacter soli]RFM27603.1 PKD domain-containing protein [Deminuibacter soli]
MNGKLLILCICILAGTGLFQPAAAQFNTSYPPCVVGSSAVKGQTPETAFPICGTTTFTQQTVPQCGQDYVPVPGCGSYQDSGPFWYKFHCYVAGTLGFLINPNNNDDYDWQLFDVTNHNPRDVFSNAALTVTANWAGTYGPTGTSATGVGYVQCGSFPADNKPTFTAMPNLVVGHDYLLMVSHFDSTQQGYSLSFGGGTAVITDTLKPKMASIEPDCDRMHLGLRTNMRMKCSSMASDGSDFMIPNTNITVVAAMSPTCNGFDMDSLVLTLSAPLPPGNYQLVAKTGSDANTLLTDCDALLDEGSSIDFTIEVPHPTYLDSITPVACSPTILNLVFKRNIQCSSIAANGSDFSVTGPTPVSITGAYGDCDSNNNTRVIHVQLAGPIETHGDYTITLLPGGDGNTIVDACGEVTPPATLHFTAYDTVSAAFTWRSDLGCKKDIVYYFHDGANNINTWQWSFDGGAASQQQNPVRTYTTFGDKVTQLIVSNGVCSDTSAQVISLPNTLKAKFGAPDNVCPQDVINFLDSSIGQISSYTWNFGNGSTSTLEAPPAQQFVPVNRSQYFTVSLVVGNSLGCFDTATRRIMAYNSCIVAVPSAFTPNGDGLNDYLYPLDGFKASQLEFQVFNRWGQRVFITNDWMIRWDGTVKGLPQPPGTYVWTLSYTQKDNGEHFFQKGTTVLIR